MTLENRYARFMRNTGPARFFVPVGLILVIFGIILLTFNTSNYAETKGNVTDVVKLAQSDGEEQGYDVSVKYTVDGKDYETAFSNISESYNIGDDIKVFYDPSSPDKTTNSKINGLIAPIVIAVGALAVIFGIFRTVAAFKKSKELDKSVPGGNNIPDEAFDQLKYADGVKEYYFSFDGHSLKPGYTVEDKNRDVLFEGKMIKQAIVGARTYEFTNHITGVSVAHEVGHTVEQSYNNEFFSAKSWFKFNGKNVWDVIHEKGIRLSTNLHSKFPYCIYNVMKNGEVLARVETCSVYVHEEDEAQHKIKIPTGNMYYRFWTASNDLDSLFLTIFAISETEQAIVE